MKNPAFINTIHENDFGYIGSCPCCNEFQIKFGNVIMNYSREEYLDFESFFNEIQKDIEVDEKNGSIGEKYIIKTNRYGLVFSFTYQELKKVIELLDLSKIVLDANQLIN